MSYASDHLLLLSAFAGHCECLKRSHVNATSPGIYNLMQVTDIAFLPLILQHHVGKIGHLRQTETVYCDKTYKILFGLTDMNQSDFFTFADRTHSTRGHAYKLPPSHCRVDVRKCFFAERVLKPWNNLLSSDYAQLEQARIIKIKCRRDRERFFS